MAKSPQPTVFGFVVAGDIGSTTIYTSKRGKKVWFEKSPPKTEPSPKQRIQRDRFTLAQLSWKVQEPDVKAKYEQIALKTSLVMTGQNIWISLSLRPDNNALTTLIEQSGIKVPTPPAFFP